MVDVFCSVTQRFHVALLPATNGIKPSSRSPGAGCYLAPCTAWFGRQEPPGVKASEDYKTPDIHDKRPSRTVSTFQKTAHTCLTCQVQASFTAFTVTLEMECY